MQEDSLIDLRSDTVTKPTAAMRSAIAGARVGDDVYGDDPSVNELEARVADFVGKAAALFVPSGTQSNLIALLTHCQRGDEYIAAEGAHTYRYEAGGGAVLGGIQPQPLPHDAAGQFDLERLAAAIKPRDVHFPRSRLLCLENTFSGRVQDVRWMDEAVLLARQRGLAVHLDGARLCNAAVASGQPVQALAAPFDSVSICLSKGLGAPAGSVLCGDEGFVKEARRWRKMLGGGMRQSGILAAAGLHAIEHHVERLADDHRRAARLADGLRSLGLQVDGPHTNMLFVTWPDGMPEVLDLHGIRVGHGGRLVLHMDIDDADVDRVLEEVGSALGDQRPASRTA